MEYVSRPEPVREQYTEDRPHNSDEYEEFRTSDYEPGWFARSDRVRELLAQELMYELCGL